MHFIYVNSEQDRDKMLALGYVLMKADARNHIWIFRNKDSEEFSCNKGITHAGVQFVLSDTLTF